ncbi:MAG TPA: hypothetical protein VHP14_18375 [Anaerolineales bacterium]|nr:hypothetical protein [Anaerolineales bacterium]
MMNAIPPKPVHASYRRHRQQLTSQIILPMVFAIILFVAVIVLLIATAAQGKGDVSRWAAVSTIWIVIPIIIASLIFLAVLVGLIYLFSRLLAITPTYTAQAQDFVQMLGIRIRQLADQTVRPVLFLNGIGASIKEFFGKK